MLGALGSEAGSHKRLRVDRLSRAKQFRSGILLTVDIGVILHKLIQIDVNCFKHEVSKFCGTHV